jgi:hypothetical protein
MRRELRDKLAAPKALDDPAFLEYLKSQTGGIIRPDPEDIDRSMATTAEQSAEHHRLAQMRKVERLYRGWKANLPFRL